MFAEDLKALTARPSEPVSTLAGPDDQPEASSKQQIQRRRQSSLVNMAPAAPVTPSGSRLSSVPEHEFERDGKSFPSHVVS
ncbi:hypothetical protein DA101_018715 [Sinorhizobium meliloti]|nr:hypothetical protein DA101_033770 [Sinorhizobium meliloti]RMI08023.1 hypothetical protein DA101_018715 [Sinorhizobium meliloti]